MFTFKQGLSFILIIVFITACGQSKTAAELVAEAKQQLAQQQGSHAEITLKNAIKTDPYMAEARYLLGKRYADTGRYDFAEKEFLKALQSGENNEDITISLAEAYLQLAKNEALIKLLESSSFEDESLLILSYILTGKAYLNLNDFDNAKAAFDQANSINNESSYSLYGSAIKATMEQNFQQAQTLLDSTLKQDPTITEGWILKAKLAERSKNYQEAISAYQAFLAIKPNDHATKLRIVNNYLLLNDIKNSELLTDEVLALNPENATANLFKARIALEQKNYSLMGEHALVALNAFPNNPLALYLSGLSHYYLENFSQAYENLSQVTQHVDKDHPSHRFLILTLFKLGHVDELTQAIQDYAGGYPEDGNIISELATALYQSGNSAHSLKLLEKALQLQPDNVQTKTRLGIIKLLNHDSQGLADLADASALDPDNNNASFALTTAYLNTNQPANAQGVIDAWLEKHPDDITALLLKAQVLQMRNQATVSLAVLEKANAIAPNEIKVLFALATQHVELMQYAQAKTLLNQALNLAENEKAIYDLLFRVSVNLGEKTAFLQQLATVAQAKPGLQWPRIILAQQALIKRQAEQAMVWLSTLTDEQGLSPDYYITALNGYYLLQDKQQLNHVAHRWQQLAPDQLQSYTVQMQLLEKLNDIPQALSTVQLARQRAALKTLPMLQMLEVRYLLHLGQLDGVDTLMNELLISAPNNAEVLQLAGLHALMQQHYLIARKKLQAAFELEPSVKTALLLAEAHKQAENPASAISFLEQLPDSLRANSVIQSALAERYIEISPSKAEQLYQQLLKKQPKNFVILNNLAALQIKKSNFNQAIIYAKQAEKLAPEHPDVLDTLGVALLKDQQHVLALNVLEKAHKNGTAATIKLHYAQALAQNNQRARAQSIVNTLTREEQRRYHQEIRELQAL